jgi:hypothetical protein
MYIALFSRSTPKHAFRSLLTRMYHQGSSPAVRASVPNGMPNIILHPWMKCKFSFPKECWVTHY